MNPTQGPWRVEQWTYQHPDRVVPTIQNDKDAIAQLCDLWPPDEREAEKTANAELIVVACNAAREANPDDPIAAARALPAALQLLREAFSALDGGEDVDVRDWLKTAGALLAASQPWQKQAQKRPGRFTKRVSG